MTFEQTCADFWSMLPAGMRGQGKKATFTALGKALDAAEYDEITKGLQRYIKHKEDWRAYCMASVFLNQERWTAEYEIPVNENEMRRVRLQAKVTKDLWLSGWGDEPTRAEAMVELGGAKLQVVR